jgi:uncharacterized protein (TIGR02466 family)
MNDDTFQNAVALPFFPTIVWRQEVVPERAAALNRDLLASIERMLTPRPKIAAGTGWQTEQSLHEHPDFQPLVALIHLAAESALNFLKARHAGIVITGCWANINPPDARHRAHTHPNNYLSGVYYVKTPAGSESITFTDPRVQKVVIEPSFEESTAMNSTIVNLDVVAGSLILFPSWLQHDVGRNKSKDERVSIAFNLMFKDYAETMSPPTWQGSVPVS